MGLDQHQTYEPLPNLLALYREHWADPPSDLALSCMATSGNSHHNSLRDASGKSPAATTSSSLCTTLLLVLLRLGLARRSSCNASNNSSLGGKWMSDSHCSALSWLWGLTSILDDNLGGPGWDASPTLMPFSWDTHHLTMLVTMDRETTTSWRLFVASVIKP